MIKEGSTLLIVPKVKNPWESGVFFNKEMEFSRDLSTLVLKVYQKMRKERLTVCDLLCGTGARGIRYAKELKGIKKVFLNDLNKKAIKYTEKNVKLNKVKTRTKIEKKPANLFLEEHKHRFDFIDIDPFGSPIYYANSCAGALKSKSMLACTATDTAPLSGTYPMTCLRRYGVFVAKTDYYKEVGIRILVGSMARIFGKFLVSIKPVLSHATRHYFRIFLFCEFGKSRASKTTKNIGFLYFCSNCLYKTTEFKEKCPGCTNKMKIIGPLWLGELHDKNFCKSLIKEIKNSNYESKKEMLKLLTNATNELETPISYDTHKLCKKLKTTPQKIGTILKKLKKKKITASRNSFSPTEIKTNGDYKTLILVLKS